MDKDIERFIRYAKVDTQSDEDSVATPSCQKELDLSKMLVSELKEMGVEAYLNEYGIVYGKVPGDDSLDPIGLNAHVDTAQEVTDTNCNPRVVENYDGGVIKLSEEFSMSPEQFPTLSKFIGDDLVVTDGTTLLGADDKAGVAIIMSVIEYYVKNPQIRHHPICFCFTPDEEIGRGPENFDAKAFGAAYAYTIDGSEHDVISIENFNAAHADIKFKGVSIHPGEAKGKLINAATLAFKFDALLPEFKRPEYTEHREGFNHLTSIVGGSDECKVHYIIRNHDPKLLEDQKEEFRNAAKTLQERFPKATIDLTIKDDYRNMKEVLDKDPRAINKIEEVFKKLNLTPIYEPIRGGTDGATFSFKGCPTPNLGTGSYNHHGRFEYLSVGEFHKIIEIVKIIFEA